MLGRRRERSEEVGRESGEDSPQQRQPANIGEEVELPTS
jgi:hypothetical protein